MASDARTCARPAGHEQGSSGQRSDRAGNGRASGDQAVRARDTAVRRAGGVARGARGVPAAPPHDPAQNRVRMLAIQRVAGNAAAVELSRRGVLQRDPQARATQAGSTSASGTPVNTFARVGMVDPFLAVRSRRDPRPIYTSSDPLFVHDVYFNDRVLVLERFPQSWVRIRLDDGRTGYVNEQYLFIGAPDPDAKLYRTRSGDTALAIAQREYNCGEWGKDGRFFTNVLVHVNRGGGRRDRGIYKEDPDATWKTTKVKAGYYIWIPSEDFARSLAGVVSSGSITYELWQGVKGFVGFMVGLVEGVAGAVVDLITGLIDAVSSIVSALAKVIRDGVSSTIDDIKSMLAGLKPAEIASRIWRGFVERWTSPDAWEKWKFRGVVVGTILAEIVMAVLSGGGALLAKAAAKFGRLGSIIRRSKAARKVLEVADRASDRIPGVRTVKRRLKERRRRRLGRMSIGDVLADPRALAGASPDDVARLFPSGTWTRQATRGRSSGWRWQHKEAGSELQIRYSGGETGRHFRDPSGNGLPYWHISVSNGKPPKLWVGPDGTLYTKPPTYRGGRVVTGSAEPFSGRLEIPASLRSKLGL